MTWKRWALLAGVALSLTAGLAGQTVSGSVVGLVLDPANAVIPNASIMLTDKDTGSVRTVSTDAQGTFRVLNVNPSTYSLNIRASGFKNFNEASVTVAVNETRDLGRINLEIGSASETVTVTAEVQSVQLSSSEKSQAINGGQLADVTLRGRDMFGYMKLIPGVVDNSAGTTNAGNRDVTSPNAIRGITINGNTSALNFTVDGITDMDTGSNSTIHYEPNVDAIQEMKVLTSNYQAEFGRNSGGTIT